VPFFAQFLRQQGRNVGSVSENVNAGLGARLAGTPEHLFVVDTRVATTLFLWALVPLGAYLRRRRGLPNVTLIALAGSMFALVGLQSYGGEIFLRVYLFSLPAVIVFVGAIPMLPRFSPITQAALIGSLSLGLISFFVFARYGNARIDYMSPQEVTAMNRVYDAAPRGSLLLAGSLNLPWYFRGYNDYQYDTIDSFPDWSGTSTSPESVQRLADEVVQTMRSARPAAYLIFTRSMEPWEQFIDLRRAGELSRVERAALREGVFRLFYRNEDAAVYVLR
jgi:hypothetical protein